VFLSSITTTDVGSLVGYPLARVGWQVGGLSWHWSKVRTEHRSNLLATITCSLHFVPVISTCEIGTTHVKSKLDTV
jgi:hypothetical protein